jgi:hypothetical protein
MRSMANDAWRSRSACSSVAGLVAAAAVMVSIGITAESSKAPVARASSISSSVKPRARFIAPPRW